MLSDQSAVRVCGIINNYKHKWEWSACPTLPLPARVYNSHSFNVVWKTNYKTKSTRCLTPQIFSNLKSVIKIHIRGMSKKYREFCVFSKMFYLFMNIYFGPFKVIPTRYYTILKALQKIIFCDLVQLLLRCRLYLLIGMIELWFPRHNHKPTIRHQLWPSRANLGRRGKSPISPEQC